jgi:hypothetical protein
MRQLKVSEEDLQENELPKSTIASKNDTEIYNILFMEDPLSSRYIYYAHEAIILLPLNNFNAGFSYGFHPVYLQP